MSNEPFDFLTNPEAHMMPLSTKYLREQYVSAFEEKTVENITYYIEKANAKNVLRKERYIATIAEIAKDSNLVAKEGLARVSGQSTWTELKDEDLNNINKAIVLTKVNVENSETPNFDRDITLSDGTTLNVEYVPYIPENTLNITNDLDQDIAE